MGRTIQTSGKKSAAATASKHKPQTEPLKRPAVASKRIPGKSLPHTAKRHKQLASKSGRVRPAPENWELLPNKRAVRRLLLRGGVERHAKICVPDIRADLHRIVRPVLHDAAIFAKHRGRSQIKSADVYWAAKRNGHTTYGLDEKGGTF